MTTQVWFQNGYVVKDAPHILPTYVLPFSFAKDQHRQHTAHSPKDLKLVLGETVLPYSTHKVARRKLGTVNPARKSPTTPVFKFVVLPLPLLHLHLLTTCILVIGPAFLQ